MTTKSPTSRCGAYWGLCLPRSSCAVWLASRPSTTSVASMTCQARAISPGLGLYVRTALATFRRRDGWWFASPRTGDAARHAGPAGPRASRPRYQQLGRRLPAVARLSGHLGQPPGLDVVDGAAHVVREQVGALLDQPDRLANVVLRVAERPQRPRRPAPGRLLHEVG